MSLIPAACAAARADCGQGRDAADLDETSRAGFRRQALDWLRADLEAWRRLLEQEPEKTPWTIASDLQRWLWDVHFAGMRGAEALGRLPEAERPAWQKLWADLADTLARARGAAAREPKPAAGDRSLNGRRTRVSCEEGDPP
jgi:hypothetical protein